MGILDRFTGADDRPDEHETLAYRCLTCHTTFETEETDETDVACTSCGSPNVRLAA